MLYCSNCTLVTRLRWSTPRNTTTIHATSIQVTHPEYMKKQPLRGRLAWHRHRPTTPPIERDTILMLPLHLRSALAPRRGGQRGQSSRTSLATCTGSLMERSSTQQTVVITCAHPKWMAVLKFECNVSGSRLSLPLCFSVVPKRCMLYVSALAVYRSRYRSLCRQNILVEYACANVECAMCNVEKWKSG